MPEGSDPRVFFAAERTLLAWIRTGLGVIGLGFVVSRFAVFLQVVNPDAARRASQNGFSWIGVAIVVVGAAIIAVAAVQHARFCRGLQKSERPIGYWTGFAFWVAIVIAALGAVLATWLMMY